MEKEALQRENRELHRRLEEMEELLDRAERVAHLGHWDLDLMTGKLTWSREVFQLFGRDPAGFEPTFEAFVGAIHPEDRQSMLAVRDTALQDAPGFTLDYRIVVPGQPEKTLQERVEIIRDEAGKPLRLFGTVRDVTARKQAEEALSKNYRDLEEITQRLEQSRNMLQLILESIPVRVFWKDKNLHYLGCNTLFAHDAGLSRPEELLGLDDYAMGWKDQAALYQADDRRVMESGLPRINLIEPQTTPSGARIWLRTSKVPLRRPDGEVFGVLGVYEDITERQRAEEALSEQRKLMDYVIRHDPNAIAIYDNDLRYIFVSDRYLNDYGVKEKDVIGKHHYEVFPEMPQRWKEVHQRVLAGAVERSDDDSFKRPDGSITYNRWECRPWYRADGRIGGIITYTEVTTDRKRAEEERANLEKQYRQAQKLESLGRLAGGVAHDFNNMLAVILGYTEIALMELQPRQPIYHNLQEVKSAAQRSADLVRRLLAFARKQVVSPKVANLNDTVPALLKMLQRLIGEDIELIWKPGADLWSVMIDPAQIDQILANLMVNARDAIAGVGQVTIETANIRLDAAFCVDQAECAPGDYVLLAVRDNGCGMDEETLSHVFEPFFTTKEPGTGTGLGLATVYGIVKQNNGLINVDSEPGRGTTFTMYLPRHRSEAEPALEMTSPAAPRGGSETVLLVEDEQLMLDLGKASLERLGYAVLAAKTPQEAIRLAEEHAGKIDLLLTDVVMPEMNGRDLAARLKAIQPGLQCLFMSGYTADVIARRGVLAEGVHFLQKPFTLNDLAQKVREALAQEADKC